VRPISNLQCTTDSKGEKPEKEICHQMEKTRNDDAQ